MTLVSVILQDAYRETNILPLGKPLTPAQTTEALRLLNNILNSLVEGDAGESLVDFPLGNYGRQQLDRFIPLSSLYWSNPPINRRLIALNEAPLTVYLPPSPSDGSMIAIRDPYGRISGVPVTLDGNGRTIETAPSQTINTNGVNTTWFFRADLGDWVKITPKIASDEMPFPGDFDDMFMVLLAQRLNPRNGRELSAESADILKRARQQFVNRYLQSAPLSLNDDISWPFMSVQGYNNGGTVYGSTESFQRGNWRSS